jgi:hypothetical protein
MNVYDHRFSALAKYVVFDPVQASSGRTYPNVSATLVSMKGRYGDNKVSDTFTFVPLLHASAFLSLFGIHDCPPLAQ